MVWSDFVLKHSIWTNSETLTKKLNVFERLVDVFVIACTIGISVDKRVEDDSNETITTIGRNTITQNSDLSRIFEFLYQNAILSTNTVNFDGETRKKYAFDYNDNVPPISANKLLLEFANYGMIQIVDAISKDDLGTLDNIIELIDKYINNSLAFEIDDIEVEEII